jgi:hypothetical protein
LLNPHRSRHGGAIVAILAFRLYHFTLFNLLLTLRPRFKNNPEIPKSSSSTE